MAHPRFTFEMPRVSLRSFINKTIVWQLSNLTRLEPFDV